MLNATKNTKGNKTQDKGVIPFYTKEAFPGETKEAILKAYDNVVATKEKMVSLKLKIDETKGETKRNIYQRQIKSITNFHNDDKEHLMELLLLLREEILPQLNFTNDYDKINTFQQYMNTACLGQAARQWIQIKMNAKRVILKAYIDCGDTKSYFVEDERRKDIIIGSKFKEWLDAM